MDNLKAGYDAELAVGQELDQLMRYGATVFHDIPGEHFNIDHVVIAKEGIFAVETKGFTKPRRGGGRSDATVTFDGKRLAFPTWSTSEPLEQAERQAAWLSKWLSSAVGAPLQALPVLALPGWFVELNGRGAVRVFNGKQLAGLLAARGAQSLSAQDVQRVVHQVEQRCRTVAPRYADNKPKP
jgi:Nuclease-related domain